MGENDKRGWESQTDLVKRIAKIATRVLRQGEGVALGFINQDKASSYLSFADIEKKLQSIINPTGTTKIGTNLKDKILQPLIFDNLVSGKVLERPVLISILTDGKPTEDEADELKKAIIECRKKLNEAVPPYPRESAYCNHTCASC